MKTLLEGQITLLSGIVHSAKPLSAILISEPGQGKSTILRSLIGSVEIYDDFTSEGVINLATSSDKRYIVVSDLNKILDREKSSNPLSVLLTITEEGFKGKITAREEITTNKPVVKGVLTGITIEVFEKLKEKFIRTGMFSRLIPICWKYNQTELEIITDSLLSNPEQPETFEIYVPEYDELKPKVIPEHLKPRIKRLLRFINLNPRVIRNLSLLIRGISRYNSPNSDFVSDDDFNLLLSVIVFTNVKDISSPLRYFLIAHHLKIRDYTEILSKYSKEDIRREKQWLELIASI